MSDQNSTLCSIRACNSPVHEEGPRTGAALCLTHFDKEVLKINEQKESVLEQLQIIQNSIDRAQLQAEQSAMAAEIEEVNGVFNELQEMLQQWRQRTVSRIQAVHESVAERLRDAVEAEQCEKELTTACDGADIRDMMKFTASAELWLDEVSERSAEFDEARSKLRKRQSSVTQGLSNDVTVRSVGDVAAAVQELKFIISEHMVGVMKSCWLDDGEQKSSTDSMCQLVTTIDNLGDMPCHLACCSNTAGFGGDSSGWIVKVTSSNSDVTPLPQPSIFVSFDEKEAEYLLVMSLDGATKFKYHSELNWKEWISGLHCDDQRQHLYVAQLQAVTVSDLSGEVIRVVTTETLGVNDLRITAICGNSDQVFLLNTDLKNVHAIGKESGALENSLDVANLDSAGSLIEVAVQGSKFLLVDSGAGKVRRVCGISGQLISNYPDEADDTLMFPSQVPMDSRGVRFVGEIENHSIRAFFSTGETREIVGIRGQAGCDQGQFSHPWGLIVAKAESNEFLVVADKDNCRVCTFMLR